ncbi:Uma2 family endonuclease [Spirulina sp. CS-785/01]|uniref:Uma2 family endonuclease n=1 Tax=Spirulina sp. CS-785/01 TaxID=3021716 RepID=UPI00232FB4FF|nr:Uma2 family endonuclease [Spirulina sp. CS-785/01]MDB9312254.1 Uma2 family endonuclease [Spirulina sp. CS-785/01]
MTATLLRWTLDDYHTIIQSGVLVDRAVELLKGLIVEMSPEGPLHSELSTLLQERLMEAAQGRYRVRMGNPIAIPENQSEPEPDIALVRSQSYRNTHPLPTDVYLVIELANTSLAKDTQEKRQIYAEAGILDYWVVNLQQRIVLVYRHPNQGTYQTEQQFTTGTISPLSFPDLTIPVASLFSQF